MTDLLAAAWKLSLYQVWNRRRRWVTTAMLLFPVLLVVAATFIETIDRQEFYQGFVTVALGTILIPFVALFWGSGVLTDEIEAKTLVYLWTRPRHRGLLMFAKLTGSWLWLVVLAIIGAGAAYVFAYYDSPAGGVADNLLIILWDWRALSLAALAYSTAGFLLSVLTKRPLLYGLIIAYLWELIPAYGPGFFKRLSITQQTLALATHKETEDQGNLARQIIQQVTITETEALLTLIGIIIVCSAAGIVMAGQREFLSDDPARNQ